MAEVDKLIDKLISLLDWPRNKLLHVKYTRRNKRILQKMEKIYEKRNQIPYHIKPIQKEEALHLQKYGKNRVAIAIYGGYELPMFDRVLE